MIVDIKIPSPGESITEVEISDWLVDDGDIVSKDQEIAEIDSDKATLTLSAEVSGKIKILVQSGNVVPVGEIVCKIDSKESKLVQKNNDKPLTLNASTIAIGISIIIVLSCSIKTFFTAGSNNHAIAAVPPATQKDKKSANINFM